MAQPHPLPCNCWTGSPRPAGDRGGNVEREEVNRTPEHFRSVEHACAAEEARSGIERGSSGNGATPPGSYATAEQIINPRIATVFSRNSIQFRELLHDWQTIERLAVYLLPASFIFCRTSSRLKLAAFWRCG